MCLYVVMTRLHRNYGDTSLNERFAIEYNQIIFELPEMVNIDSQKGD